jgi:hypothetical protein
MLRIIEAPEQVRELSARIRAARDSLVKSTSRHADEMDAIYRELAQLAR